MSSSIQCNVREIVAVFGGRSNLARRINTISVFGTITPKAVDKWMERGGIPAPQMDKILALAQMSGPNIEDFVLKNITK